MQNTETAFKRALTSGTLGGLALAATASLAGKRETGSYVAPLNATSHIVWGDSAAAQNAPSLKYTMTGFLLNHAASLFWAAFYEKLFHSRPIPAGRRNSMLQPLIGSALVSAGAYITDYYLVPRRFTPGFEKRLSGRSLFAIYAMLTVGMAARDLLARSRHLQSGRSESGSR